MRLLRLLLTAWLASSSVQPPDPVDVTITLQRTICFGACPAYTVTIAGDGRVEYVGEQFVRVRGKETATIPPEQVAALVEAFETAGFFDLKNEYTANITDLPTTITSIRIGDRFKRVIDYYGAPQVLKDLERSIDKVAGTARWVAQP